MKFSRKIRQIIVLLHLTATIFLFFKKQTNKHIHVFPNCEFIIHSHSYSKNNNKLTHTSQEISFFSTLNNVCADSFFGQINSFSTSLSYFSIKFIYFDKKTKNIANLKSGRSPPFIVSSSQ